MSAHQQSELPNGDLLGMRNWAGLPENPTLRDSMHKPVRKVHRANAVPRPGHEHPICDEEFFLHTLALERKRSERSGKPFLLLLLDGEEVLNGALGEKVVADIERHVFAVIRDIDVCGWYEQGATLGVIFTEIDDASGDAMPVIVQRITEAVQRYIAPEHAAKITITCHAFPEKPGDGKGSHNLRFYPDVPRTERHRGSAYIMKRAIDLLGSMFALAILSPVFLVIALLIKLTSRGPVFFRQVRVGQYGKTFTFLKFRSMHVNNDPKIHQEYVSQFIAGKQGGTSGTSVFKIQNDPRVTRIGRFIRRASLDELPQFLNVLCGEMSLVGPRPPVPYEVEKYDVWHRRRVMEVKPGITGLWQVSGRSKVAFDDMVRLDLKYARKWSIAMDLKILCLTPRAVFSGDGAY